jgi:hypothetical protein
MKSAKLLWILLILTGCRQPYVIEPIVSEAVISKDWTEFRPPHVLGWSQPVEELSFRVDTPHRIGDHLDIIGPSGEKFVPEVELIAADGKSFLMDSHGFLDDEVVFSFKSKPVDLRSVEGVRIRSSTPVHISNMVWRGYDPKTVKR